MASNEDNSNSTDLFPPTQLMKPEDYEGGEVPSSPPSPPPTQYSSPEQSLPNDWLADELDQYGLTVPRGGIACATFTGNSSRLCWICGSFVSAMHENVICSAGPHIFHYCGKHKQVSIYNII
jgi:hypothetical protein